MKRIWTALMLAFLFSASVGCENMGMNGDSSTDSGAGTTDTTGDTTDQTLDDAENTETGGVDDPAVREVPAD